MKTTFNHLIIAKNAFADLSHLRDLKAEVSFSLSEDIVEVEKQYRDYDEKLSELMKKYAEKDEAGNLVDYDGKYKISDREAFASERDDLMNEIIDVDMHEYTIDDFKDVKGISPLDFISLKRVGLIK